MLSAAVAGTIFASPAAEQVKRAVLGKVDSEAGVLVVVMNYTVILPFSRIPILPRNLAV